MLQAANQIRAEDLHSPVTPDGSYTTEPVPKVMFVAMVAD